MKNDKSNAVINHHKNADGNNVTKSINVAFQAVHAIRVVISQNGDQAHPALAATTILIADGTKNFGSLHNEIITVDKIKAVVRLSAIGDRKKAINQIIQNNFLNEYHLLINFFFKTLKTPLSTITSI
jgi:hypothetical protein